jgi:hypothetical protein
MNVIANLAVNAEGGYCGNSVPNNNTPFPADFEIDYIRVWQKNPQQGLSDLCAQRQIQGNNTVCSGQQVNYNFIGPMTSTLIWSVSPNLVIVSQNTTSITVQPQSNSTNGNGWISVQTSAYEPCPQTQFTKSIWIGNPIVNITVDASEKCPVYLTANVQPNNLIGTWTIISSSPYTVYDNYATLEGSKNYSTNYSYTYSVSNECGTTTKTGHGTIPKCPKIPLLIVSPNPANQSINIKIEGDILKEDIEFLTFSSQITGFNQNLDWNNQDLSITVAGYNNGIYYISLKLKSNEEIFNEQLLIQH